MTGSIELPGHGSTGGATADARANALALRTASISMNGAVVSYVDEGSGPVVLLLHGAPVTSLGFARVVRELRSTHRVVAPDLPGFGGSELPRGFGGTLDEYARFVTEFVHELHLRNLVMYVNDSSGCVGIAAATRLEPGTVRGLVVADTVPIPLTGGARIVRFILRRVIASRLVRWINRRFNLLAWMVATVAPWLHPFSRVERATLTREFDSPDKRDRMVDLFEHMAVDEAFMQTTAKLAGEKLRSVPTLVLYGQLDPMRLIGGARRFRKMFPNSQTVIIPKEEHFPILASGARVGATVREWMDGLPEERRE